MDGDESACTAMENIEDPIDLLPLYLQEVMEEVEERFGDTQYDLHIPSECREAGATDRKSFMGVMFKIHAPEECIRALEEGRISIDNEREARKACEEIMFTENAPEECVEAGIRDPRECGKLMFKTNAPPECIEAGLTGESRDDDKKCRDIMERVMEKDRRGSELFGGADCRRIESPEERLKCYDGAIQGTNNFDDRFRQTKEAEKQCAQSCLSRGGAWDFTNGECSCNFEQRNFEDDFRRDEFRDVPPPPQGEFQQPPEGVIPPPPQSEGEFAEPSTSGEGSLESGSSSGDSGTTTESSEPAPSEPTPTGNAFYNFYYR